LAISHKTERSLIRQERISLREFLSENEPNKLKSDQRTGAVALQLAANTVAGCATRSVCIFDNAKNSNSQKMMPSQIGYRLYETEKGVYIPQPKAKEK